MSSHVRVKDALLGKGKDGESSVDVWGLEVSFEDKTITSHHPFDPRKQFVSVIANVLGTCLLPMRHDTEWIELLTLLVVEYPSFPRMVIGIDGSGDFWRWGCEIPGELCC